MFLKAMVGAAMEERKAMVRNGNWLPLVQLSLEDVPVVVGGDDKRVDGGGNKLASVAETRQQRQWPQEDTVGRDN